MTFRSKKLSVLFNFVTPFCKEKFLKKFLKFLKKFLKRKFFIKKSVNIHCTKELLQELYFSNLQSKLLNINYIK